MKRVIAHIDMDAFFPSVEVLLNPKLKGLPVVVGAKPWERGVVSSSSYEARKYGVRSGMSSHEAGSLCPHAVFIHGHFDEYSKYSKIIHTIFCKYSPCVEMVSCDEAYLDFSNCNYIYPDLKKTILQIQSEVNRVTKGLTCSVGVGTSKTIAKIASDYKKPIGFVWIDSGKEKDFLEPLEIRKMPGIGPFTEKKLINMGCRKLGDIQKMPYAKLFKSFGKLGWELRNKCMGIDDSEIVSNHDPKSFSKESTFECDTCDTGKVLGELKFLVDRVATTLRSECKKARNFAVKIRYSDFSTLTRSKTIVLSTDSTKKIWGLAKSLFLENYIGYRKIRLIGVRASDFESNLVQSNIFSVLEGQLNDKLSNIDRGVDKIREKYGNNAIQTF